MLEEFFSLAKKELNTQKTMRPVGPIFAISVLLCVLETE